MTNSVPMNANEFIEQQLHDRLEAVEGAFDADALCMVGDLVGVIFGVDDLIRDLIEGLRQRTNPRTRLIVLLTTNGGYIETVKRIVDIFRHHYAYVGFVIPNYAFSAGTVLVMSGDDIFMDYYSRLGPIDPQARNLRGRSVPALGYLKQWERLIKKAQDGTLTVAEMQVMVESFDQAELYQYEQARELSISLLKEWLANYKFKNWTVTQTRGMRVTAAMRKRRAAIIAQELNNTDRWHSHGYGISMDVLQNDPKLNLRIEDLSQNPARHELVKQYDGLLADYMLRRGYEGVLHTVRRYQPYM